MATLTELQTRISARFYQAGNTLSSTTTEWARRRTLLNAAAREWDRKAKGAWPQLRKSVTLSTAPSQNYVDLPSDFKYGRMLLPESEFVKIGEEYYPLYQFDYTQSLDSSLKYLYISGNGQAGYRLNINPTPNAVLDLTFSYYSTNLATNASGTEQTELSLETDITLCPDPDFLVAHALMEMFSVDDEGNLYKIYSDMSKELLNDIYYNYQIGQVNEGMRIPLVDESQGFAPIGGFKHQD